MKMSRMDDLNALAEGKPFIRSILAYMAYLRFGGSNDPSKGNLQRATIDSCYAMADQFLEQLEKDLHEEER